MTCTTHACDGCAICAAGTCCGAEFLGPLATWEGPTFVDRGALELDGDGKLICHACGESYHALGKHTLDAHGLSAEHYREAFGLGTGTSLNSPREEAQRRALGRPDIESPGPGAIARKTPEQRELLYLRRQGQPANLEAVAAANAAPENRPARVAGGEALARRRREDQGYDAAYRAQLRKAHRKEDPGRACPVCEATYCPIPGRGNKARTCGRRECITEAQRRAQAAAVAKRRERRAQPEPILPPPPPSATEIPKIGRGILRCQLCGTPFRDHPPVYCKTKLSILDRAGL